LVLPYVGLPHGDDQLFLADALLPGANHDGGAVGVVGADIHTPPPAEFLEPDPDVRLQILDEMSDMDMPIGIRQGAGHKELLAGHVHSFIRALGRGNCSGAAGLTGGRIRPSPEAAG
jgi:hypothetical protein